MRRLAAYAAVLVAVFALAFGAGRLVRPDAPPPPPVQHEMGSHDAAD
ncbi:hypothetical protein ACQP00_35400 [Dactylosporangium sp. CS-047395]